MSDYDELHSRKARFIHIVLRAPDSVDTEDIQVAMDCLIGHARQGHGMFPASATDFAKMLTEGGLEAILEAIAAIEERYRGEENVIAVRSKAQMDADPFGLIPSSKDEVLH